MPIVGAQCIVGNEKYPDVGLLINYNDDDYRQGYHQIKQGFKALTHDDLLQPYISGKNFRSSNDGDNIAYDIHAFEINWFKVCCCFFIFL